MEKGWKIALFSCMVVCLLASSSSAQTCRNQTFPNNKQYANCIDLPVLKYSTLHWTYDQEARTVDLAYRHVGTNSGRWSAWAINPNGAMMVGSQALVAYVNSTSGAAEAFTTQITCYAPSMTPSALSFPVRNLSTTFENNDDKVTIFAVLTLPQNLLSTNQVWQEGPYSNGQFLVHPTSGANVQSATTINFLTEGTGMAPTPLS